MFTALQRLDLHHNLLRALPLEFATLVDEVKEIDIIQNPFDQFPPKWNFRWTEKEMYQNPSGYGNQEVFEYIKDESMYFTCAEDEWKETGALHFDNRLNFKEFVWGHEEYGVTGVAKRMGKVPVYDKDGLHVIRHEMRWHDRFLEHLKRFYFTAKEVRRSDGRSVVRKERSDDNILHGTITNNLPLVTSFIAVWAVPRYQRTEQVRPRGQREDDRGCEKEEG
jgi:hypothetical protein